MSEQDYGERELNHRQEVLCVILIANGHPAKVVEPGKESFDLPAATVAAQRPKVLGLAPIAAVGSYHLDPKLCLHLFVQAVAVVSLVSDQPLRVAL